MQIRALKLEDTKSYESGQVHFSPGTNAIVGQNGSGKSTILEAIGFALFDYSNYKRQNDFVREGKKSATVTVTFRSNQDERDYEVIRRCGSSSLYYIHDPELKVRLHTGKVDVLAFLKEHMGVDEAVNLETLFKDAIGVPQGNFTSAFLLAGNARKSIFDPLLRVAEYKLAFDRLREPAKLLRDQQRALDIKIEALNARLERLPILEQAISGRVQEITGTQIKAKETEQALHSIQSQRQLLDARQQTLSLLKNQYNQLEQRLRTLDSQSVSAQKARREAEEAQSLIQANQADASQYEAAQTRQRTLEEQAQVRQRLEVEESRLDKNLAVHQTDLKRFKQTLDEIAEAEDLIASLMASVQEQEQIEERLATAQRQSALLGDAESNLKRAATQHTRLQKRAAKLAQTLDEAALLERQREVVDEKAVQLRPQIDAQREAQARYEAEAGVAKKQTAALESIETSACPVCEQPLEGQHRAMLLERNQQQLQSLRDAWAGANQSVKESEQQLQDLQNEVQRLDSQLRKMPRRAELDTVQHEISACETALAEAEARVAALSDAPKLVVECQTALRALGNPRQRSAVAEQAVMRRPQTESALATCEEAIQMQQAKLNSCQAELARFANLAQEMVAVTSELSQYEAAYRIVLTHQQRAKSVDERIAQCEAIEEEQRHSVADFDRIQAELAQIETQFDAEEYQQVMQREQQLRGQQGSLSAQLKMLQQAQAQDQAEIATLQAYQDERATLQTDRTALAEQEQTLESLRKVIQQAGPFITKALIRRISDGAGQIFSEMMQDYSRHLAWHEDYGITLEVEGRERQFAQLSGGEQMSAALAVRLALLKEMSNVDVAFFDEPTTNLDESRRESLAQQILRVQGFTQLFVISHDDTFEQATQNIIRVRKEGGVSIAENEDV